MIETNEILPIIAIIISLSGLIYQYFGIIIKIKEDIGTQRDAMTRDSGDLKARLSSLETKTELFWRCVENKVVDVLKTYPSNIEKDVLLDKLSDRSISLDEAERLRTILDGELRDAKEKKFAYIIAIGRIEQIIYELRELEDSR